MVEFCAPTFSSWKVDGNLFFNPCLSDIISLVTSLLLIVMTMCELLRIGSAKPSSDVNGSPVVDGKLTLTCFALVIAAGTIVERAVSDVFDVDILFYIHSAALIIGLGLLIVYFTRVRRLELNDSWRLKIVVILFTVSLCTRLVQVPTNWHFVVWLLLAADLLVLVFFMFAPVSRINVGFRTQPGAASNGHRATVLTTALRMISYGLVFLRFQEYVTWPWAAVLSGLWVVDILAVLIPLRSCSRNEAVRAAWEPVAAGPLLYTLLAGFPAGTMFRIITALAAMDVLDKSQLPISLVMIPFCLCALLLFIGIFSKGCLSRTNRAFSGIFALLVAASVAFIWLRMDGTWAALQDLPWLVVLTPIWVLCLALIAVLLLRIKRLRSDDFLADLNPRPLVDPGAEELSEALRSRLTLKENWTLPARNEARYQWLAPLGDLISLLGHVGTLVLVLLEVKSLVDDASPAAIASAKSNWGEDWYEMAFLSDINWAAVVPLLIGEALRFLTGVTILFLTEFYPRCRLRFLLLRYTSLKDRERRDNVTQQKKDIDNAKRLRRMGKNLGPQSFGSAKLDVIMEWMRLHLGLPEDALTQLPKQFDPGMSLLRIAKESRSDHELFVRLKKFVGIKKYSHFYKLRASLKYMTEDIEPKLYHRLVDITPEVIADQWLPLLGFNSVRLRKALKRERIDGRVLYSVHNEEQWLLLIRELEEEATVFGSAQRAAGATEGGAAGKEEESDADSIDGEFEPTSIFRSAFPASAGEEKKSPEGGEEEGKENLNSALEAKSPVSPSPSTPVGDGHVPCETDAIARKAILGCINQLRDKHTNWNMHHLLSRLRKPLHFAADKGFDHSLDPAKYDKPLQSWSCKDASDWLADLSVPRSKVDAAGSRGLSGLLLSTPWFRARHLAALLEVPRFIKKGSTNDILAEGVAGTHRTLDSSVPPGAFPPSTGSVSNRFFDPNSPSDLSDEDRDIPFDHMLNTQYESISYRFKELRKDALQVQEIWGLRLAKEKEKRGKLGKKGRKKKKEQLKELEMEVLEGQRLEFAPGAGVGLAAAGGAGGEEGKTVEVETKGGEEGKTGDVVIEMDTSNSSDSDDSESDDSDMAEAQELAMATAMSRSLQESESRSKATSEQQTTGAGAIAEEEEEELKVSSDTDDDGDENPTFVAVPDESKLAPTAVSPARGHSESSDEEEAEEGGDEVPSASAGASNAGAQSRSTSDEDTSDEENPVVVHVSEPPNADVLASHSDSESSQDTADASDEEGGTPQDGGLVGASVTPRVTAAPPTAAGDKGEAQDEKEAEASDSDGSEEEEEAAGNPREGDRNAAAARGNSKDQESSDEDEVPSTAPVNPPTPAARHSASEESGTEDEDEETETAANANAAPAADDDDKENGAAAPGQDASTDETEEGNPPGNRNEAAAASEEAEVTTDDSSDENPE